MQKLKKVLLEKGIIYDEPDIPTTPSSIQKLVTITETMIVTAWYSDVMDPELRLFDRNTFKPIGGQYLYPERSLFGYRTWGSFAYGEEER